VTSAVASGGTSPAPRTVPSGPARAALAVAVASDGVRVPLGLDRVRGLAQAVLRAERVRQALVSIAFVTPAAIARLNRRHLDRRGSTDVIAFAFVAPGAHTTGRASGRTAASPAARSAGRRHPGAPLVGDIYIAPDVARRNAHRLGVGVREELARLVVHGVLHVTGHDHPESAARVHAPMWRRQEHLLQRFLPAVGGSRT